MVMGAMAAMRGEFARQLRPFKNVQNAEIRRRSANWVASVPAELISVHYEPTRSEDQGLHTYSESGLPAYTIHIDGFLATPLVADDQIIIGGRTFRIEFGSYPSNVAPKDEYPAVLIA